MAEKNPNDATTHEEMDEIVNSPKRGRPAGKPAKAKRQNYAEDLRILRDRVKMALDVFARSKECKNGEAKQELVDMAISLLGE